MDAVRGPRRDCLHRTSGGSHTEEVPTTGVCLVPRGDQTDQRPPDVAKTRRDSEFERANDRIGGEVRAVAHGVARPPSRLNGATVTPSRQAGGWSPSGRQTGGQDGEEEAQWFRWPTAERGDGRTPHRQRHCPEGHLSPLWRPGDPVLLQELQPTSMAEAAQALRPVTVLDSNPNTRSLSMYPDAGQTEVRGSSLI